MVCEPEITNRVKATVVETTIEKSQTSQCLIKQN